MADNHFKIAKGITLKGQSADPANPVSGDMYYNTVSNKIKVYENGAWHFLAVEDVVDTAFTIVDAADSTKKIAFDAGGTTGTKTTLTGAQTADRVLTLPDATDTLAALAATQILSNKQVQFSSVNDSTVTGANATLTSFTTGIVRLTNSSLTSISGIPGGASGRMVVVENKTGNTIVVNNEETTATASDRIQTGGVGNVSVPNNATLIFVYDSTSSRWQLAGGSGSGSSSGSLVNYITNSSFETDTTGWATYADAAAVTPVDGTGGSPNSTFGITASAPLRGTYSGLFTKNSGASRQGEGFSYAFTIAAADKSLPLSISWEGLASANYTGPTGSEYLSVYIYDVTNSTLITPSSTTVAPGSSKGKCTFNATTSTSYRLIFHIAGTGTSAWTYQIDSVSVGPQVTSYGLAMSDWQVYTPTISPISGYSVSPVGYWRRIGDSMRIRLSFVKNGSAGTGATALTFGLPTGYTIDTTKLPAGGSTSKELLGSVAGYQVPATSAQYQYNTPLYYNDSSSVRLAKPGTNGTLLGSDVIASSEWNADFEVPISSWSSNVQMGDRAIEEYAYTSGAFDSASSATVFGSGGQATTALTNDRVKTITWANAIQPTDTIVVEGSRDGLTWGPMQGFNFSTGAVITSVDSGGGYAGVTHYNSSNTQTVVTFYNFMNRANDDSPTTNWPASGAYWRVRKISSGAAVGFPIATSNILAKTDSGTPAANYIGECQQSTVPSSTTAITSEADIGGTIVLTPGWWSFHYSLSYLMTLGSASGIVYGYVKVTDSSNNEVAGTVRQAMAGGNGSAENDRSGGSLAMVTPPIYVATTTTYKLRCKRTDDTGSPHTFTIYNDTNKGGNFFAIRHV